MKAQDSPNVLGASFGGSLSEPEQLADDGILRGCHPRHESRGSLERHGPSQTVSVEQVGGGEPEVNLEYQELMKGAELAMAGMGLSRGVPADDEIRSQRVDEAIQLLPGRGDHEVDVLGEAGPAMDGRGDSPGDEIWNLKAVEVREDRTQDLLNHRKSACEARREAPPAWTRD